MAYINGNKISFSPKFIKYDGYDMGFKDGQLSVLESAEVLKGHKSGAIISANDVSPIEHKLKVKVESKNLFDKNQVIDGYVTDTGMLIKSNQNKKVAIIKCNPNTDYTVSFQYPVNNSRIAGFTSYPSYDNQGVLLKRRNLGISYNFNSGNSNYLAVYFYSSENEPNTLEQVMGGLQIERGTIQTTFTPYTSDFSDISVSRLGKNLATPQQIYKSATEYEVVNLEGKTAVKFISTSTSYWNEYPFKPSTQYTISFDARVVPVSTPSNLKSLLFCFKYSDNTTSDIISPYNDKWTHYKLTSDAEKTVVAVGVYFYNNRANCNYIDVSSFQLEESSIATEYEEYNLQTATANADGTVEGITSVSPSMTLTSNNTAVLLECGYLRDIDLYIDNLITDIALTGGE